MYEIPIQNQLLKTNQITAMHMMVAIIFIILGAITSSVPKDIVASYDIYINIYGYIILLLGILIIILSIFFNKKIIQSKYNSILRYIEVIVLISILIYTFINSWYLPFTYATTTLLGVIFAIIWEHHGKKQHAIKLDKDGLYIPKFLRQQKLNWHEIERLMIKHGLVTIDCRNNKLYQFQLTNNDIKEEVSTYAQQKIEENESKYDAGWDA